MFLFYNAGRQAASILEGGEEIGDVSSFVIFHHRRRRTVTFLRPSAAGAAPMVKAPPAAAAAPAGAVAKGLTKPPGTAAAAAGPPPAAEPEPKEKTGEGAAGAAAAPAGPASAAPLAAPAARLSFGFKPWARSRLGRPGTGRERTLTAPPSAVLALALSRASWMTASMLVTCSAPLTSCRRWLSSSAGALRPAAASLASSSALSFPSCQLGG